MLYRVVGELRPRVGKLGVSSFVITSATRVCTRGLGRPVVLKEGTLRWIVRDTLETLVALSPSVAYICVLEPVWSCGAEELVCLWETSRSDESLDTCGSTGTIITTPWFPASPEQDIRDEYRDKL